MCRYADDDYAWMVSSQDDTFVDAIDHRCGDCGRSITAGEVLTHIIGDSTGGDMDDRAYVSCVNIDDLDGYLESTEQDPAECTLIREEDQELWEALGYTVYEIRDPWDQESNTVHFYWCAQCQLANYWLKQVCDQLSIGTVREDLAEHLAEYDEETLGAAFVAMESLCSRQWRHRTGGLANPLLVADLSDRAVAHALAVGMHP